MSYSDWTDRVVAASFAGDVKMTSFTSTTHDYKNYLPNSDRHNVCKCAPVNCDLCVIHSLPLSPPPPPPLSLSLSLYVTVTLSHWRRLLLSKIVSKLWTHQLQLLQHQQLLFHSPSIMQ